MKTDILDYPSENPHYQLSPRAVNWPTLVAVLIIIPNFLFWSVIAIKNAGFETSPYFVLHLSSQVEALLSLPVCIEAWIFLFAMGIYILDPIRPKSYRIKLLISLLVFIFINLYGFISYTFGGSKNFETVTSYSIQNTQYHLALIDDNWCDNPPCTIAYSFRLYQCDTADISCQILFDSEKLRRWIGEPNKTASLSNSLHNMLQVIVDDKVFYTHKLSP